MTDVTWFIESTQIVLPKDALDGLRDSLEEEFMITVVDENNAIRVIGSPVVITEVADWLSRQGISIE